MRVEYCKPHPYEVGGLEIKRSHMSKAYTVCNEYKILYTHLKRRVLGIAWTILAEDVMIGNYCSGDSKSVYTVNKNSS